MRANAKDRQRNRRLHDSTDRACVCMTGKTIGPPPNHEMSITIERTVATAITTHA